MACTAGMQQRSMQRVQGLHANARQDLHLMNLSLVYNACRIWLFQCSF